MNVLSPEAKERIAVRSREIAAGVVKSEAQRLTTAMGEAVKKKGVAFELTPNPKSIEQYGFDIATIVEICFAAAESRLSIVVFSNVVDTVTPKKLKLS